MTEELKISELPPLSPVPSGELPVSQMHGTARVTCKATVQELVQSVAPRAHSHTPADIGLGNVNNTSDANKPVSGPTATAIANALQAHVNATNPHGQYATTAQVTQIVTAQAGGLAPVQSVNGQQGAVTITKAGIGLGNVADLSPADMPVSTAVAAALGSKLDAAALAPALAGKIDSADARFTGIQRQKAQVIPVQPGTYVINPSVAAIFVDQFGPAAGSGPRTIEISEVAANPDDLVWFDYIMTSEGGPVDFFPAVVYSGEFEDFTGVGIYRFVRMPSTHAGFPGRWVALRLTR